MEGDAGTRQLNPTDADETPDESLAVSTEDEIEQATELQSPEPADEPGGDGRRPPRLGAGWVAGICAALLALAAGAGVGGYLALRSHDHSEAIARADAAALQAAANRLSADIIRQRLDYWTLVLGAEVFQSRPSGHQPETALLDATGRVLPQPHLPAQLPHP